jgi:hypothetical protein
MDQYFLLNAMFNGQFYAKLPKALYAPLEYPKSKPLIDTSFNSRWEDIHSE